MVLPCLIFLCFYPHGEGQVVPAFLVVLDFLKMNLGNLGGSVLQEAPQDTVRRGFTQGSGVSVRSTPASHAKSNVQVVSLKEKQ